MDIEWTDKLSAWGSIIAAVGSVLIGVGGCLCPNASSATQMGITCCALWNMPPTSASDDDATTCRRPLHSINTAPLQKKLLDVRLFVNWKYPATLLLALGSTKYAASEST